VIIADTSAILLLLDRDHPTFAALSRAFEQTGPEWVVPWAVLPEVDYLVTKRFGSSTAQAFLASVLDGLPSPEWGRPEDLSRALELDRQYSSLQMGLTDAIVMAQAERLQARAIVTLDERDFRAVTLAGNPEIWPADLTP
jgi:uncharacterized protein